MGKLGISQIVTEVTEDKPEGTEQDGILCVLGLERCDTKDENLVLVRAFSHKPFGTANLR